MTKAITAFLLAWGIKTFVRIMPNTQLTVYKACLCLVRAGKNPSDDYLEGMMSEAPGPINFTMFLTMFGERLNGTDPEDVIRNAFACFDEEGSGEPDHTVFYNLCSSQEYNMNKTTHTLLRVYLLNIFKKKKKKLCSLKGN